MTVRNERERRQQEEGEEDGEYVGREGDNTWLMLKKI